jgi:hypothetical protein
MSNLMLKRAYGVEKLSFYRKGHQFHCRYGDFHDAVDINELDFLLKALSAQQGVVFFDDVGELCVGMNELKFKYLIFSLAGL